MSREEDKARLNQEIARLKQMHADRYGEFKLPGSWTGTSRFAGSGV